MISKFRRNNSNSLGRTIVTKLGSYSLSKSVSTLDKYQGISKRVTTSEKSHGYLTVTKFLEKPLSTDNSVATFSEEPLSTTKSVAAFLEESANSDKSVAAFLEETDNSRRSAGSYFRVSSTSRDYQAYLSELDKEVVKIAPLTENASVSEYGGGARVIWAMSAGDREAEAQAKKGDEAASNDRDSRAAHAIKTHWCVGLRALELALAVIAIGLIAGAFYSTQVASLVQNDHRHLALIYSAYSSFIIITGVLIIARLFGETIGWRTSLGFSVLGCIMFTAAAAVIFYDWHRSYYANMRPNKIVYDLMIASGVFAVLDAVVFLIHAFFTFRKEAEY